ncbi:MAG: SUMF1/EgtB/PvdO family nonheme iron enzyme, partial [Myxococcales bacterium]|nr:SUMF1/EgtB/PvdO family nonheme iron enzyme [Myxococcales bacterium]
LVAVLPWALPGRTSSASLPGSGPRGSAPSAPGSDPSRGLGLGGTTPMSPGQVTPAVAASATPPGLGTARTVHDAAAVEEHAPLPVEGGFSRVVLLVAVVALVGLGVAGALALRGRGGARGDADAGVVAALPPCPRGMVRIPGAEVTIGRDDGRGEEAPAHRVVVQPFCVDDGEVTAAAYQQCVDGKSCPLPAARAEWPGIAKEEQKTWGALCNFGKRDRSAHPMNCVTYDEAQAYCASQGRRLPSETEWELAARGAEGRAFPWGNDPPGPKRVNACDKGCTKLGRAPDAPAPLLTEDDGWEATSPSGQLTEGASALGVFDLAGNVAEWTEGPFCPYGQPACGNVARTIRGGSFLSDDPAMLRGSARAKASPQTRAPHIGFRCAK